MKKQIYLYEADVISIVKSIINESRIVINRRYVHYSGFDIPAAFDNKIYFCNNILYQSIIK